MFFSVAVFCLFVWREQPLSSYLTEQKPRCSVEVIRKYCVEHNYFPTGGHWLNSSYAPDICRVPSEEITTEHLRECLSQRNVTKLVVLGDSNGLRYFKATMRLLKKFLKCRGVKGEIGSTMPDVNYFTQGTKLNASDIFVHPRDCMGCTSAAVSCTDKDTEIKLEYIVMEFFLDTEMTTVRNRWQKNCHPSKDAPECHQSNTYQEFLLSEYLEGNYPDVMLLFSPSHDKARSGRSKIRSDMEYLKMLIDIYVPKQTRIFWFSKISENQRQKGKYWRGVVFEEKYETNAYINQLNRELFDVIRPELMKNDGNISPFFDVYDMSLGVLNWTFDGMHRRPQWYQIVLSNWIHTFCEN